MTHHPDDLASVTAANRDRLMGVAAAISTITNSENTMIDLSELEAKARAATQEETDGLVSVTIADGKYTIREHAPHEWECLRYGEYWPAFAIGPDNLHIALAREVDDLRARVRELEAVADEPVAWMHPESLWVHTDYEYVAVHCELKGKQPISLYAAPPSHAALQARLRELEEAGGSKAATDVLSERRRQIDGEGWTDAHDDEHSNGELAAAAATYITEDIRNWPWDAAWWKPSNYRRNLVKAGALILAEIERIDRAALGGSNG